jgi:chorismate mutase
MPSSSNSPFLFPEKGEKKTGQANKACAVEPCCPAVGFAPPSEQYAPARNLATIAPPLGASDVCDTMGVVKNTYRLVNWRKKGMAAQARKIAMPCRGIRGATTVARNDREEILTATRQLLALMIRRNGIDPKDVASALFSTTRDIDAEFPALAARQLGWLDVPLLCGHEMTVPGSLPMCIRVMVHWNTDKPQNEIEHVYIRDANRLRPDLSKLPPVDWEELESWITQHLEPAAKSSVEGGK